MMSRPRIPLLAVFLLAATPSFSAAQVPLPDATPSARLDGFVQRLETRTGQDMKLTAELRAFLVERPGAVAELPGRLRSGAIDEDTSATLLMCLERVGTPEAQDALVQVSGDAGQRHLDRLRAVVACGAVSSPADGTLAHLWGLAATRVDPRSVDVADTALLALGVAGGNLRLTEPSRYPDVRDALVATLQRTPSRNERCNLLKALGNLHDPDLGLEVEPWLFDASTPVRASAALAIGLLHSESSREVILVRLGDETHGAVRAELVASLRRMKPDPATLAQVHAAVVDEPHPEARAEMLHLLIEHRELVDDLDPTLEHLVHDDPTARIRLLAAAALYD